MASATEQPVTLLLMGRTGNGKSSTGNSILRKRVFKTSASKESTTYEISKDSSTIKGQEVIVVDGPGIRDAQADKLEEEANSFLKTMNDTFLDSEYCSGKFIALLIVLKYGVRYTRQEKDAVMMIKSVFGSDVLEKYGIIVLTHGDSFELDMEDEDFMNTFEDWCKEQGGDVKALFEECGNRCVLFNNKSKKEEKLEDPFETLMSKVGLIRSQRGNYTENEFQKAKSGRTKLIVLSKLPKMEEETRKVVDKINSSLNEISDAGDFGSSIVQETLKSRKDELDEHEKYLEAEDKGTGVMQRPMEDVKLMQLRIQTLFKLFQLQRQELNSLEEQEQLLKEISEIQEQEKKESVSFFSQFIGGFISYLSSIGSRIGWLYNYWSNSTNYKEYEILRKKTSDVIFDEGCSDSGDFVEVTIKESHSSDPPCGTGPST